MDSAELTTSQVARRLKVGKSTVNLWCQQGRFKNARLVEHPRGNYWAIPATDLENFEPPKMGRPPKPKEEKGKGSKKRGGKK
jgi:hypothetical protein